MTARHKENIAWEIMTVRFSLIGFIAVPYPRNLNIHILQKV